MGINEEKRQVIHTSFSFQNLHMLYY